MRVSGCVSSSGSIVPLSQCADASDNLSGMDTPSVSVIVPTYNRAALLEEAIASVLAQTFTDWELIVVDDGSTDATAAMLAKLDESRLRVVRVDHTGSPARVRNAGLAVARGKYVAFLDDDDLWRPEKLAVQVPLLERGRFRWSYTGFVSADVRGTRYQPISVDRIHSGYIIKLLLDLRAAVALPTVVAERALLAEVGGFDAAMRCREDYALWLTLCQRAEVVATRELLTIVRDHPGRTPSIHSPHLLTAAVYHGLLGRLGDPTLRWICRQRLADMYVAEAGRCILAGQWWSALAATLRAIAHHPRHGLWRALRAVGRRLGALGKVF